MQNPGSQLPEWPLNMGDDTYVSHVDTFSSVSYGPLIMFLNAGYTVSCTDPIEIELAGGYKFISNKLVTTHMVPLGIDYIEINFWALEDPTTPLIIGNNIISALTEAGVKISFTETSEVEFGYEEFLWRKNSGYQAISKYDFWLYPNTPTVVQLSIRNPSTIKAQEKILIHRRESRKI